MCIHIPQRNNLKMKAFTINSQNKNQEISIHMTFILEIKLQKESYARYDHSFSPNRKFVLFEPLLGWQCVYVCHDLRTEKEGIYV